MYTFCQNCQGEHHHEVLEQIHAKGVMLIEARCNNCFAVTTTRYKTELLYRKVLTQTQLLLDEEHHEPNEHH
ncbi:MAG: hypothetical protein ACR2IQ_02690 [Minisyncoccia bacterium]